MRIQPKQNEEKDQMRLIGTRNDPFRASKTTCLGYREALGCLEGSKIVIAGDSIMRQFFNAGISMFRGQVQSNS